MAVANKKQKDRQFIAFCILTAVLLLTCGFLFMQLNKQLEVTSKYDLLEKIDNQACRYLDQQAEVNGSFDLTEDSPSDQPRLTYTCTTGQTVDSRQIQGKLVPAYYFGAKVSYFASNEAAEKYAEQNLKPLRNWGDDKLGLEQGLLQNPGYNFVVNDEDIPYFDSYTVKANAVLRVSLPCHDPDVKNGGVACYEQAKSVLHREMKGINVL